MSIAHVAQGNNGKAPAHSRSQWPGSGKKRFQRANAGFAAAMVTADCVVFQHAASFGFFPRCLAASMTQLTLPLTELCARTLIFTCVLFTDAGACGSVRPSLPMQAPPSLTATYAQRVGFVEVKPLPGSAGTRKLAIDLRDGEQVAIKLLIPQAAQTRTHKV
jgi:hypothetical protein